MLRSIVGWGLAIGVGSVACGGEGDGRGADGDGAAAVGSDMAPVDAVAETGCGCSTSPALQALSCAPGDGVTIASTGGLELAPGGDVALFTLCYSSDGELPADRCRVLRWTQSEGTETLVDSGYHVGLADDGAALVVAIPDEDPREVLLLVGPDGTTTSVPLGPVASLSANGRYVVGFVPEPTSTLEPADVLPFSRTPLARWSLADGLETLAELPDELFRGTVSDVAADASVIVGVGSYVSDGTIRREPLLYTDQQGLHRLDASPGGQGGTIGFVSRDGSAFAGLASSGDSDDLADAFHWTNAGGFRSITTANPTGGVAFYQALSDDGLVLAGTGWLPDAARHRVYRWTEDGLSWLGPDDDANRIADMTADGSLVLGTLIDSGQGFIAAPGETRRLDDLLEQAGLDATGWELKAPLRISDDGKVVFGSALCGGVATVYRWVLPE
jgi:hypothetical protein